MLFSEIMRSLRAAEAHWTATITEDWAQGRATFGGLVAALGNEAMRALVQRERPLRSLQTTFVGPAAPGAWRITPRVLRTGRAVTIAHCEIFSGDDLAATMTGVYGGARPSAACIEPAPPPAAPTAVDALEDTPFQPGLTPTFIQHFAMRWSQSAPLFSSRYSPTKVFVRHRDPAPLTEAHVIALVDCIPSPALAMFASPAPASSMTWTLEFLHHDFDVDAEQWWRLDTDLDAAADGYVHQDGVLIDPRGRPCALTRQLVAVFG